MSSPMTATFLAAWLTAPESCRITLAKVELVNPSAVTLRAASREVVLPDGSVWEQGLRADPIRSKMDMLGTGPNPADCTIYLSDRLWPFMSSGSVVDTLATHQWQGAKVTLYLWVDGLDASGALLLDDVADLPQVFEGTVDGYSYTDSELVLNLLQPRTWNKPTPPDVIDASTYPNAPDVSLGNPKAILYGPFTALGMRAPHTDAFTNKHYQEEAGAGTGVVPLILVDPGTGAANVKLLAAGHPCAGLFDRATGHSAFAVAGDVLAPLDPTGITATNGASESYLSVNDDSMVAYFGVRASDVRTGAGKNSAGDPRRAMDPFDETSYATLDQAAGKTRLQLQIPSVPSLGRIIAVDAVLIASGQAANANLRVYPERQDTFASPASKVNGTATATTPFVITGTWDAAYYTQGWDFGYGATVPVDIIVDFASGTTCKAKIFNVFLRVKYRPVRSLVTPGRLWGLPTDEPFSSEFPRHPFVGVLLQPVFTMDSQFFANLKGYVDDGSGTFTGSAGVLIERVPDIIRHFLATFGAQTQFETGSTTFGSFVGGRSVLRNSTPLDFKLSCWVGQLSTVQQVVQKMCEQSLCAVTYDRFTSKWLFHTWKQGAAIDYDRLLAREDLPELFESGVTSDVDLTQGVRVQYAFDHFRGKTMFEAFVTAAGSSTGYTTPTVRDQRLVIAPSTSFGYSFLGDAGHTTFTGSLGITSGTYTSGLVIAEQIRASYRAIDPDAPDVGYGFSVKTGYNDKFDIKVGATVYTATIGEGAHDADSACRVLAAGLNACGSGLTFTVTYSPATNLFTIVGSAAFYVMGSTGGNRNQSAAHAFGWNADSSSSTSQTSSFTRLRDRFWFLDMFPGTSRGDFSHTWSTATAASPLGFDAIDSGTVQSDIADQERGVRETTAVTSQTLFGPKGDEVLVADWVRDEHSAVELRNRRFDFGSAPRAWVRFRTQACPDMQRMRVIGFHESVNERRPFLRYGSDGSWANKAFRVLEVEQDLGPSYHTEIYAIEA